MMRNVTSSARPPWFFWFMAAYTAFQMIWFGVLAFDFITHPFAPDAQLNSVAYRLFSVLVVVPIALVVSALVVRRAPGNVTGLCLLLWMVTVMGGNLRAGETLLLYNGLLNTGWTGLWLLGIYFPNGRTAFPRLERWIHLLSVLAVVALETLKARLLNVVDETMQPESVSVWLRPTASRDDRRRIEGYE